jgi:hypothetical protein
MRFPGGQSPGVTIPFPRSRVCVQEISPTLLLTYSISIPVSSAGRVAVCSGPSLDYLDLGVTIPDRLNRTSSDPDTPRESVIGTGAARCCPEGAPIGSILSPSGE